MKDIFKDLIVVELASVLAGPAVGMFFAELGAKVIKFENETTGGDVTRKWRSKSEDKSKPYSSYYCSVNYNKQVILSNLSNEADKVVLIDWIKKADIVVANFKQSSAEKLGLDYKSIKSIKEDIIYAQLDGYPEGINKVAFDVVMQAETGYLSMCGQEDGRVAKMPVALIDILAAHQLKEAILIALLKKMKSGDGSYVSTSLYESAIASLANQATNWLMNKSVPQKMGTLHPNIAPYGELFKTKDDKEIVLAIGTEQQFTSLCNVLNLSFLASDNRFAQNVNRVENRTALSVHLEKAILANESSDLLLKCDQSKIPIGLVQNLKEVFDDPKANKLVLEDYDASGNIRKRVSTISFSVT